MSEDLACSTQGGGGGEIVTGEIGTSTDFKKLLKN